MGVGGGSGFIREVLVSRLLEIYSTCLRLESMEREENFG